MKASASELSVEILRTARRVGELSRVRTAELGAKWAAEALEELATCVEELKVAEEELRVQNEELAAINQAIEHERHSYRELFMSAPNAYVVSDLSGTVTLANRAAGQLLDLPPPQLAGKPLPLFVSLADRDRFQRWMRDLREAAGDAALCADCGGQHDFELRTFSRDRSFRAQVIAAPVVERDGAIHTIRWMVTDLSDRDRAAAAEKLEEEARRKDEFLAVLGHELRNPLAAITLASDILAGGSAADPRRFEWAADLVRRHAEQLSRLVGDLLDASRMAHGKVVLQLGTVDLGDVVTPAVETIQALLDSQRHTFALALPEQPVLVRGDAARLTQVIANLLDNAAKYTPPGGHVSLEVKRDGGTAVIAIKDDGVGIAPDMIERIFETFEQVGSASEGTERGLGLGLSLVRELVALHGGNVRAASGGDGAGSTFTVELPLAAPTADVEDPAAHDAVEAAADVLRMLIIDGDQDAAELLALPLRRRGFVVDVAADGSSGLAQALRQPVHVALVEVGLPDMSGLDVCRQLRGGWPEMHVLAVTGNGDEPRRTGTVEASVHRTLVKPVSPESVLRALRELGALASRS